MGHPDHGEQSGMPVSLDGLRKDNSFRAMRADRDLKPYLLDKNYADFGSLPYEVALERLLRGLSRRNAKIGGR